MIEIDPRLRLKKRLKIFVHEALHEAYPELKEAEVVTGSVLITNILWEQGYRKVEK